MSATERRRRRLELALGGLWLLDGALQFQPSMFTRDFFAGILGMANMGLPGPLSNADYHVASLLVAQPVWWNTLFASTQVLIGAGLVWGRGRPVAAARPLSLLWALAVWIVGEGVGGMFMGGTSLLTGAPGAAVLYAVLTVAIWPAASATASAARQRVVTAAWVVAWAGSALLELQVVNHASGVPGAQIAAGANGEPGAVAAFNRTLGHALGGDGLVVAAALGALAVFAGLGVLSARTRRAALVTGLGVAVFTGLAGQDLGALLTGSATDPGSGPLFVLLAISLWPPPLAARLAPASPVRLRPRARTVSGAQPVAPAAS